MLSFNTISRFFRTPLTLFNASNTMPEGNAPSPITATEWRSTSPLSSSPLCSPKAVETLQPACPVMNKSYSLSAGLGYPIKPPFVRIVPNSW